MGVKFASRVTEWTSTGMTTSIVWQGSLDEMMAKMRELPPGSCTADGRLKTARVYQDSPQIWSYEQKFALDGDGEYTQPPDTAYGKKSAQLKGSMLSLPLETHKDYRANWNYYLAAAPDVSAIPTWWASAKDAILTAEDSQKYVWVKTLGELPTDKKGRWRAIKNPEMPGIENYDEAVYSVTETARFRSATAAGRMVANNLNRISAPNERFGVSGGNWKCDDASVGYNGADWLATLTWTRSGDNAGWNTKLYTKK